MLLKRAPWIGTAFLVHLVAVYTILRAQWSVPGNIVSTLSRIDMITGTNRNERLEVCDPSVRSKVTIFGTPSTSKPSLPRTCYPLLENGTFSEMFVRRTETLIPLSYTASLLGLHGVHTWLTASLDAEMAATQANELVPRARMTQRSKERVCTAPNHFERNHLPERCSEEGDDGGGNHQVDHPPYHWPWCFPPTDPVHLMSIDCGILDNYFSHPAVTFTLFTDEVVVSTDRGRWKVRAGVPVHEFDELAVMGAAEYATEPGHFPNEDLGALLFLDMALPLRIPLLWPHKGVAKRILTALREAGLISERQIIQIPPPEEAAHFRARRMYYFRTNRDWNEGPWVSWYAQRLVQQQLLPVLERRTNHSSISMARRRVVVFQRTAGTKRSLDNHHSLMEALKRWLPEEEGFSHDSFIPGPEDGMDVWDTGDRVYQSCLVIGPHGGNMPNMMFLRQGCWVVEIGYDDATYPLPSDFYCFARNLGLTYWLSVGDVVENGMLVANLEDIQEIVHAYKKEVLALQTSNL